MKGNYRFAADVLAKNGEVIKAVDILVDMCQWDDARKLSSRIDTISCGRLVTLRLKNRLKYLRMAVILTRA